MLIVGGGVVADICGLATALYDRNTPYIMLCTNNDGYKNLYGAYHPPVMTFTDRTFWSTLHEGWLLPKAFVIADLGVILILIVSLIVLVVVILQ